MNSLRFEFNEAVSDLSITFDAKLTPIAYNINKFILHEAEISPTDVANVFRSASEIRGDGKGLVTKGKAGVEKAQQFAGQVKQQLVKIKKQAEADPRFDKIFQAIDAGGEKAKQAIKIVDDKVNDTIVSAESKLRQSGPAGEKVVDTVRDLGNVARRNPKTAGFVLAAMTSIVTMATGGVAGPAVGLLARGALELAKGEKFSTAVKKGATTAALGGVIGAGAGIIGDVAADVIADIEFDKPVLDFSEVTGTDLTHLDLSGNINGYHYDYTLLLDSDALSEIQSSQDQMNGLKSFSEEWYKAQADFLKHIADLEASPEQDQAWAEYEAGAAESEQLQAQYEKDLAAYEESKGQATETYKRLAQAMGAGAAGAAGAKAEKTRESLELNRIRELAGLPPINEGPVDWAKDKIKGAAKKVGQRTGISDKDPISTDQLTKLWKQHGQPTDTDEVTAIMKDAGFHSGEIKKAYKKAGVDIEVGADQKVVKFANAVKAKGLAKHVADHIEKMYNITESVLHEKVITDRDIKQVIVKLTSAGGVDDAQADTNTKTNDYVKKWMADIKAVAPKGEVEVGEQIRGADGSTYTWKGAQWVNDKGRMAKKDVSQQLTHKAKNGDQAQQKELMQEILGFLTDRKGTPEYGNAVKGVENTLKQLKINPEIYNTVISQLRQMQTEGRVIHESHLLRLLNYLEPDKGLGRRRKP